MTDSPEPLSVLRVGRDPELAGATGDAVAAAEGSVRVDEEVVTYAGEARARIAGGGVDCVLTAPELPDTDGLTFLSDLRKTDPLVPVVVVADTWEEDVAHRVTEYGGTDYVVVGGHANWRALLGRRILDAVENYHTQRGLDVEDHRARTERTRFQRLFERSRDCIAFTEYLNGEPIIRRLNPAFQEVFGYSAPEAIGENLNELVVPDEELEPARELDLSALDEEWVEREVRRETADGEVRDFLFRGTQVTTETGAIEGYPIYTDITERKERERELERKNELLDEFAGVVSHDVATPLGVIESRARLVEATGDTEHVEAIYEATERVRELTDELLALAQQGERVGETGPVGLEAVAREAWASVETPAATLTVESSTVVEASRDRLRQLLANLLDNAVEHGSTDPPSSTRTDAARSESAGPRRASDGGTNPDGAKPAGTVTEGTTSGGTTRGGSGDGVAVRVGVLPDGEGFYVADDGPGVPPEDREAVFEQGFTTGGEGTGLGLAIVARIAEGHGWTVRAAESRDGGARFEVLTDPDGRD